MANCLYSRYRQFAISLFASFFCTAPIASGSFGTKVSIYTFKATDIPPTNLPSSLILETAQNPVGDRLGITNFHFTRDGKPWLPFMAEFHYARTPSHEWEFELEKIKAAGVNILSTYCFWIHHEELQGEWDWKEQRNLRRFVELCAKHGLLVYLRIGPYCHGGVRNGGLPNWILHTTHPRTTDPIFLELVRKWYAQISLQVKGLLFFQGGPIIGIQLDNEYVEHTHYLEKLKQLAVQEGLDVPYYSATAWGYAWIPPSLLPVWGSYPDAPWKSGVHALGPTRDYLFAGILGTPQLGLAEWIEFIKRGLWLPRGIPLTAVEVGGGNQMTFRRRPVLQQTDMDALAITMLGRGANLLGIYMFHGGSNPIGRTSPLNEPGYPKISYDFQAPLGEFGQPRPWYHSFRNITAFLHHFGALLAPAVPFLPDRAVKDPKNIALLRCALRASPQGAFLFFHNYQRSLETQALGPIQFHIALATQKFFLPPLLIPKNAVGIWPINLDLKGLHLKWATAQPLYLLESANTLYCFLKEIPGIAPQIALDPKSVVSAESPVGTRLQKVGQVLLAYPQPGMDIALSTVSKSGHRIHFAVLSTQQAEASWQANVWGRERILISNADFLTWSDTEVRAFRTGVPNVSLAIFPSDNTSFSHKQREGIFRSAIQKTTPISIPLSVQPITSGRWSLYVAQESPSKYRDILLRITYVGNIATLSTRGKIVADNFYNGQVWEVSLHRFLSEPLELNVTPLKYSTPICLPQWPTQTRSLTSIEALPQYEFRFH